ncbi:MAG: MBL fold metallo-hydrolase [Candidatus Stygibacter australis]|nr:MBL fold metallo-hydrolase [Candidatus Stygibacter australis]MDP8322726.1 MBL fold metallo-hydrolase [Candidatus Stygibacter australis]
MKIQVLYDNTISESGYLPGWGFSCLIDGRILFDTGEHSEILFHNMEMMKISVEQIEKVVISHDHYDHRDGLWQLLKLKNGLPVYICEGFSDVTKAKIEIHGGILHILNDNLRLGQEKDIFLFGGFEFEYKGEKMVEQCLVLTTQNGVTVIAGCSHPGIVKMVKRVHRLMGGKPLYLAAGGFHLKDSSEQEIEEIVKELQAIGIQKMAPTHCTGAMAQDIFKYYFQENCLSLGAGKELII